MLENIHYTMRGAEGVDIEIQPQNKLYPNRMQTLSGKILN